MDSTFFFRTGDLKVKHDIYIIDIYCIFAAIKGRSLLEEWFTLREHRWVPPTNSFNSSGQTGVPAFFLIFLRSADLPFFNISILSPNYPLLIDMSFEIYVIKIQLNSIHLYRGR